MVCPIGHVGGNIPPEMQQANERIQQEHIPVTKQGSPGGVYNAGLNRLGITKDNGAKEASFIDSYIRGDSRVDGQTKSGAVKRAYAQYIQPETQQALGNPVDTMMNDFQAFPGSQDIRATTLDNIDQEVHIYGAGRIAFSELERMEDAGLLTTEERSTIEQVLGEQIDAYGNAFPNATDVAKKALALDNARKLAFQTVKDKQVFSGSDHGTLHVVTGNIGMARKMREGLSAKNVNITDKDWAILMQANIDHDMGYTTRSAQTSFEASKDHPLASAMFIQRNSAYYDQYFGQGASGEMCDMVLTHSYPAWDGVTPGDTANANDTHWKAISSLVSTCDALGTTSNVKTPKFFSDPKVVRQLAKQQMARMAGLKTDEYTKKIRENLTDLLFKYSDAAKTDGVTDDHRLAGMLNALEANFNEDTSNFFMGQLGGRIDPDNITIGNDLKPLIQVDVGDEYTLMANTFGIDLATNGIFKAMDDMGVNVSKSQIDAGIKSGNPTAFNGTVANFNLVVRPKAQLAGTGLAGAIEDVSHFSTRPEMDTLKSTIIDHAKNLLEHIGGNTRTEFSGMSDMNRANIGRVRDQAITAFRNALKEKMPKAAQGGTPIWNDEAQADLDRFTTALRQADSLDFLERIFHGGYANPMEQRFIDPTNLKEDISKQDENLLHRFGPDQLV